MKLVDMQFSLTLLNHPLVYEHAEWITHHSALITQEAKGTNMPSGSLITQEAN
jgi:hypothetical protein